MLYILDYVVHCLFNFRILYYFYYSQKTKQKVVSHIRMKLYLHVFDKSTPSVFDTITYTFANEEGTLQDLQKEVQKLVPQVILSS